MVSFAQEPGLHVVDYDELKRWVRTGRIYRHLLRYTEVVMLTPRVEALPKPWASSLILRVLSRGSCRFEDRRGGVLQIDAGTLMKLTLSLLREALALKPLREGVQADISLQARAAGGARLGAGRPVYLRSDLAFGLAAGGAVGHVAGVLNSLPRLAAQPVFITPESVPTVDESIETHVVLPDGRFRDFRDAPMLAFNRRLLDESLRALADRPVSFVYQRYSAYNYTGVALARRLQVPFVLEYNGSEVWINRIWGRPLRYEELAERIEMLNLRAADLIVVVSDAMREELLGRGIDEATILVNPNGVDPDRYSPDVDGRPVRDRLGIGDETVVGFIGTFGKWHGAEKLAVAFNALLDGHPDLAGRVRLLMIGDGEGLPATRRIIEEGAYADRAVFVGRVPQAEGPGYLAACDVLVSPHVPNPDGSRFFGSPTKLFEYMAMGRPMVASRLEQIGEVVEDGVTALLVQPGDTDALAAAMARLIRDPALGRRLGMASRAAAVERHTWRQHTARILERLEEVCA
jgi:glycosyltransferase involved in cell wall biosynthesis